MFRWQSIKNFFGKQKTVYFGPQTELPSWHWVGKDVANYLAQSINISFFDSPHQIKSESVVFWIKHPPSKQDLIKIKKKKLKVIYLPVDTYSSQQEIERDIPFIETCKSIGLHSSNLKPFFNHSDIHALDHYNKFGIEEQMRQPGKRFLWVGGYQYVPYLIFYLLKNKLLFPIDILTDFKNETAKKLTIQHAKELNLPFSFSALPKLPDLNFFEWREDRQKELLMNCAGAFDYKHIEHFNQLYKPPTKVQKYISSAIPTAVNKDSYSFEYFNNLGFQLCAPDETDRWQSKAYQNETREFAKELKNRLSLENVAKKYLDLTSQF